MELRRFITLVLVLSRMNSFTHTPILFLLLHLLSFCVRCNLCWWQFFFFSNMVSLLYVYPPINFLRFSSPPCVPHAPPTYFNTSVFFDMGICTTHTVIHSQCACMLGLLLEVRMCLAIIKSMAWCSHLFPWYTFTPVSMIYLQLLAMNFIASTSFMLKNWITLHTLTFDHLVSGPAIIKWKLYSSMMCTVPCSSCVRHSACTYNILKFMVRWCCVIWVMALTCVLKLPYTFN